MNSPIVKFESSVTIEEEASLWVARLDRGLNAREESEMIERMSKSPRHREELYAMLALWDRMDSLSRLSVLCPEQESPRSRRSAQFVWPAVASVVCCAALLGVLFSASFLGSQEQHSSLLSGLFGVEADDSLYETRVGESSTVSLSDGSKLILNTDTAVRVQYMQGARLFHLQRGEIHIDVAHDAQRPLSVIAGDKVLQAVGTAFNVQKLGSDEVELIVTDGTVRVVKTAMAVNDDYMPPRFSDEVLAVEKGEKITLHEASPVEAQIDSSDFAADLSWREGNLVFRGETLEEALAEIGRYTDIEFQIEDETIRNVRIAGLFKAGDVNGLLVALRQNFSIASDRDDVQVYLHAL